MPLVGEVLDQSVERLLGRLHAVRGVQDVPAAHGQAVRLVDFERRVLAVLARDVQAARHVGGLAVAVAGAPVGKDQPLPRDWRDAQVLAEGDRVVGLGVRDLALAVAPTRLLPAFSHGVPRRS